MYKHSSQTENRYSLMTYTIIDKNTGEQVGKPLKTLRAAHNKANKLDLKYGAIRYSVVLRKR